MSAIQIRPAAPGDAELLATFNRAMALETEGRALDPATVLAGVGAVLMGARAVLEHRVDGIGAGRGSYLVAELDGRVVGGLLVTDEHSDWRNGRFLWIQSVYVEPQVRGRGVFRALHAHVRERARADPGVCGLRLYVERDNERAQRVYASAGMTRTDYLLYEEDFGSRGR